MTGIEFIAAVGDINYLVEATMMSHGSIEVSIIKPKLLKDGSYFLDRTNGLWCLASVIDYARIGWTVCFNADDYFAFDLGKARMKSYLGDCLTMDDKQAILDRLREGGLI